MANPTREGLTPLEEGRQQKEPVYVKVKSGEAIKVGDGYEFDSAATTNVRTIKKLSTQANLVGAVKSLYDPDGVIVDELTSTTNTSGCGAIVTQDKDQLFVGYLSANLSDGVKEVPADTRFTLTSGLLVIDTATPKTGQLYYVRYRNVDCEKDKKYAPIVVKIGASA